jgi:two-component sensor histidine kinase
MGHQRFQIYAYPAGAGEVRVHLKKLSDGRVELAVEDDGVGRNDGGILKGTGLGARIVNAMASSMAGDVEYLTRAPGTVARLVFSLEARQSQTDRDH